MPEINTLLDVETCSFQIYSWVSTYSRVILASKFTYRVHREQPNNAAKDEIRS